VEQPSTGAEPAQDGSAAAPGLLAESDFARRLLETAQPEPGRPAAPSENPEGRPRTRPKTRRAVPQKQVEAEAGPEKSPTLRQGFALEQGAIQPAAQVWTEAGTQSLESNALASSSAGQDQPAALAVPLQMQGVGDLLLEIVDDSPEREWSEDDRFLVMEVAAQLTLALDNAQLYLSVQQELAERIRAEQAILRRNKDLAALNQVGQQLSRLATRAEIFDLLARMVGEVLDNRNIYICTSSTNQKTLLFPVYRVDGEPVEKPAQPFGNGAAEYVMNSRETLLIAEDTQARLVEKGIDLPERIPTSLLAIPMIAGERAIGAVVVQDFSGQKAFDAIHAELLSTAAAQATTALENAELFQQMQNALQAIENRERYQSNVARSAAILTEFGTKSMPEVLKALGQATQCSRVYFAQVHEDERGLFWSASAEWVDPGLAYLFDKTRILHIPVGTFSKWAQSLRDRGWTVTQASEEQTPEAEFLNHQHIRSTLLLAVPGQGLYPSFIAFDQFGSPRIWQSDEIDSLRVAADAISNTFIREDLLEQLQITLEETEGLYKASNRLALANDMQEMVAAILSGVRVTDINRSVLLLFDYDTYGKLAQITVGANWYSGRGTPPPPVGAEYLRVKYERFFQTQKPVFYDDILEAQIDKELQETMLHQNMRALAILPLWSGKRQIGVLLLQSETRHHFSDRETRTYPPLVDQMAIAVENQHLFEQTQKALSETELLYNVANGISQASGAQDMLAMVVSSLLPAGADRAALMLIESDANGELASLELVGAQEVKGEYNRIGARMPVSALPLVRSLTDEPVIITDIHQHALDPASRRTLEQMRIAACCLVPLRTSGQLIGVLNASARLPVEFAREDIRLLRIVASGIAVALEKQRLLRQAQRRALELQTASEIARDTASTLSLDLLLPRIVEMMCERFGFYHASIFLLDDAGAYAVIRESTGDAGKELKQRGHRLAIGSRSVVGTVTATGEPFILNDVTQSPLYFPNPLLGDTRSEMGVPLKLGTTVIGALDLQSRMINAFNQDDVTVLQILADQIAIAIENARAYELSQKAIADMREIDRVKSQFLANMSHELRTPLNSIIGFSRVILKGIDGPINETQGQDLSAIYHSGQHLLSLINDILDLSKIEAGKMELAFTDVNLVDMINSAMSTAVGLVKDKPIKLHTQLPESLPLVRADNTRVRQVLINFLSNAAKFTEEGSITVEASLIAGPQNKPEAMVSVTDTGPGIAPEDQAKLFLPFSQVDDSPTRKTGGTGLGLSICRSLIEMHGGRIGLLSSVAGQGSTFFFTLPLSEEAPPEPDADGAAGANVILAIDDDLKVINLYERYLRSHGYRVVPLTDPKLSVERVKELRPFAVTLDIMMPEKDGWQVMQDLRNCPETRDTPIIICSILESQEKGFSMGAADYLVKPFLQDDMINAIGRLNRDGQIKEVLVVDDDAEDLRLVKKMLEQDQRFQVTTAQGGVLGWESIQARRPDIIILDLFMPEMNGFNILENLRKNPALRRIPVIVLTGADLTPEQHQQLTDFGQGVMAKGYLREKELLVLLEEALQKFHPQKSA
jgi:signal transduction histidine kinase/DNA-binding response OmpR family regulator